MGRDRRTRRVGRAVRRNQRELRSGVGVRDEGDKKDLKEWEGGGVALNKAAAASAASTAVGGSSAASTCSSISSENSCGVCVCM